MQRPRHLTIIASLDPATSAQNDAPRFAAKCMPMPGRMGAKGKR